MTRLRQKCPYSFFSPTHTTSHFPFPLIYNFSSSASFTKRLFIFSLLLLHYLHLVHKTERSSTLPVHLQKESSSFIIFFYFIIFLWCTKWKSHISFKNLRKFLVYPLILCFIPNPWKNYYSIFFKLSHIISLSTKETMSSLKSNRRKRFKKVGTKQKW